MDPGTLRDLVLNVSSPIVLSGIKIPWIFFGDGEESETMEQFLARLQKLKGREFGFDTVPQVHGDSPQFEMYREKLDRAEVDFNSFLDYSVSDKQKDKWITFSYKPLRDFDGISWPKAMDMGFCGFPEVQEEITLWLGTAGSHTPCHYDTYGRNVVVQVHGHKRWLLFSPDTPNLEATRVPYEESSVYSLRTFFSPKDPEKYLDLSKHCIVVDLSPGDVLIVPPKWWHYVEALDNSLTFNAWIPLEEDHISRIDECLVLQVIGKMIEEGIGNKWFLVFPEYLERFPMDWRQTADYSLSKLLKVQRTKDAKETDSTTDEDGRDTPRKKARSGYTTNYLSESQLEEVLQKNSHQIKRPERDPELFMEIIRRNSARFCPKKEEGIIAEWNKAYLTTTVSLINCFCAPTTIEAARKHLLESYRKNPHW